MALAYVRPFRRTCAEDGCHDDGTQELWTRPSTSHGVYCDRHINKAVQHRNALERRKEVARGIA
jgi:hypothetical protein